MVELHAFFAPQVQHRQVAPTVEYALVGAPQQLVAVADKGAQGFAVRLPGEVDYDVLEVLTQGAEQHVQLGGAGHFQRVIAGGVGEDPQAVVGAGERAVDQGGVQASQVAQGVAEIEGAVQAQQRQAVAPGQAEVEHQRLLAALLHHHRQVARQQGAIGIALGTVEHGEAAKMGVRRAGRQALAQAPHQPGHFAGA